MINAETLIHFLQQHKHVLDQINGFFESGGAVCIWLNVLRLKKDQQLKGVDWRVTAFFTLWGFFNLLLYPLMGMWWSALGGLILCLGNVVWLVMAIKIVMRERGI